MGKVVSKKMLINVMHPEEARVAIVHDGLLMELNIEISGKEQTKGNIYKGVVLRVEPGLQAAFVDIGRAKPGFLQIGELHPDLWQWRDDVPEDQRKRRPRIQEVLRRGQELVVQVEKDERDNKGSALTSYLSLPGRYMVIMPGSDSTGISRKVEQESVRKHLKEVMAGMQIPEGIGYIVRTQAVGRSPEELQKDMESLLALYESIKKSAADIKGAGEIYRDKGLIIRFIRDYFSDDIDEVVVDSKEAYNEAREFFRENMPACEKLVKLHKEKRPVFSRFQIEEQIDQIYEKRVPLPSGGSLIIEPTEALVSIDVNSGKSSGERGIEDTAFKTNMEAAEEVARQLRLRDLGGLIMIDFIDMRDRKHNHEVEKTLKQALKMDKARVNLGRISDFGILEMSRQRIAKTLNDAIHLACPHCEGRGKVKSVEAMALSFLRKIHGAAAKGTVAEVHGGLPLEVAYYLLNRKKRELVQIENDYDIEVHVKGKTSLLMNQLELEIIKREKIRPEDLPQSEPVNEEVAVIAPLKTATTSTEESEQQPEQSATEGTKKRKRRRKKKKPLGEPAAQLEQPDELSTEKSVAEFTEDREPETAEAAEAAETTEASAETAESGAAQKKRRRRRRKPSKTADDSAQSTTETDAAAAPESTEPAAVGSEPSAPLIAEATPIEPATLDTVSEESAAVPPEPAEIEPAAPALHIQHSDDSAPVEPATEASPAKSPLAPATTAKPKKARAPRSRKKPEPDHTEPAMETPVAADETAPTDVAPVVQKPRRRSAPKKIQAPTATTAETGTDLQKPAPRKRRSKKDE
ncbi:MAG: Rne/Rng family ribonuclease [Desulfuromonadales bacterium]|nr:Rne/Rng family ribonuclease [Desulfuromonadales bacterium]